MVLCGLTTHTQTKGATERQLQTKAMPNQVLRGYAVDPPPVAEILQHPNVAPPNFQLWRPHPLTGRQRREATLTPVVRKSLIYPLMTGQSGLTGFLPVYHWGLPLQ